MVEAYKGKFIEFLLQRNVLLVGGSYGLKSKRVSPYFLKLDAVDDGEGKLRFSYRPTFPFRGWMAFLRN